MYVLPSICGRRALSGILCLAVAVSPLVGTGSALGQGLIRNRGIVQKIATDNDQLEMTVNTSQILTLGSRIPRIQVNNPAILSVTPLSATEIQVAAKQVGVTQINLWDEQENVFSVDVTVLGDARELELALRTQFPNSAIKVYRYSNSLVLKGFVDRADHVSQVMRLAEDYAPKVVNNISVGGVHQIMLRVRVMEVSRTKLRRLGVDFAQLFASGSFFGSSVSGLIANIGNGGAVTTTGGDTFRFGIVDGGDSFFAFLDALEENRLGKILAEPTLTTVSGRPATFNVGGEFPVLIPQSLGTISIDYKKYGTQVDFLPVVLGNGNIRLEVRPRITEIDESRTVVIEGTGGFEAPALLSREVDTGVEMKAGQTLALAGLGSATDGGDQSRSADHFQGPLPGRALSVGPRAHQRSGTLDHGNA